MITRRNFITNTSLALSGAILGSCNDSGVSSEKMQNIAENARNAMLAMQRASW